MLNSDKTLQALAKHVHSQLLPSDIGEDEDEDSEGGCVSDQLPLCCVESAITHVAIRVNYGAESMPNQAKVPANLRIWRWEVDEKNFHWLPKSVRDKLKNRLHERRQVRTSFPGATRVISAQDQVKAEVAMLLSTSPVLDNPTIPGMLHTDKDFPTVINQQELLRTHPTDVVSPVC